MITGAHKVAAIQLWVTLVHKAEGQALPEQHS